MEKNNNAEIQDNNVVGMVLKKSCVPTEPKSLFHQKRI